MYIQQVMLNTGVITRIERSDVPDGVVAIMGSWVEDALARECNTSMPDALGVSDIYRADVTRTGGGLVCSILGAQSVPLVTFGVATRSRHAHLWPTMIEKFESAAGIKVPEVPWCAVVLHPAYQTHQGALLWLEKLVQSVAWSRLRLSRRGEIAPSR
jgi:hypothetical protein